MIARQVKDLPVVLTCFALRDEYFPELTAMLATVGHHHAGWPLVIGRGTLTDGDVARFEVETPTGQVEWTLSVPLQLAGGEDDWRRITRIKGWWLEKVWEQFGGTTCSPWRRIVWLDADARLNAPLDFRLCPDREIIAGPWWYHPNDSRYDTITSGLLLFQGTAQGPVADILRCWSRACLEQIEKLAAPTVPWPEGDQEVLTHTLAEAAEAGLNVEILKLDHDKYCGIPTDEGKPQPNALVDHWMMSARMGRKGKRGDNWPPPEYLRRPSTP
jgi:hypothetical protein